MVLESISKFFRLVLNGVYIDGNVLVPSLVKKTRLLLQEAKGCRRYNGPGYDTRYLMVILIKKKKKSRLCCLCKVRLFKSIP